MLVLYMQSHRSTDAFHLSQGADASVKDAKGKTALHLAAGGGHTKAAAVLAHPGVVDVRDQYDGTPLLAAAAAGHEVTVHLLLDRGVSTCM